MQKKFISNLFFILFLNLLIKPYWILGIERDVQNTVGVDNYGIYFLMLNFGFLFNIFLDLGLNHYNNREVSRKPELLQKYFSVIASVKLALGLLFIVIVYSVGRWIMGYSSFYLYLLLLIGFNQILLSFLLFLRSNIAGLQLFKIDSVLSVLDRSIVIILCAFLLWFDHGWGKFKIEWFAMGQTIGYVIAILVALVSVLLHAKIERPRLEFRFIQDIIKSSMPFALLNVIMMAYSKIDTVMLGSLLDDGTKQAGIYAQGYKLPEAGTMLALLFATLLYPMFSRMLAQNESIEKLLILASKVMLVPVLTGVVAVTFYATDIIDWMYDDEVTRSAELLPWLMATFLALAMTNIYGTLLTSNGSLKQLNVISIAGLLLNIILNYLLIPHFKALGSAIATVATQWMIVLLQLLIIQSTFKFRFNTRLIGQFLLFVTVLIALGFALSHYKIELILGVIIFMIIGGIGAMSIGLIRPKDLIRFAKQEV